MNWTGNAGDSLWTNSKNWNPHGVPGTDGTNDAAVIDQQGSNFVILNTNLVIGDINVGGSQGTNVLELAGISVQCSDSITIATNGTFEIQGSSSIVGGSFQNSGTILVPDNLGIGSLTLGCHFTNNGTLAAGTNSILSLPGTNSVTPQFLDGTAFAGPGTVLVPPGNGYINCLGTITVNGTVEFQQQKGISGSSIWNGPGLLRWDAGGINGLTFGTNLNVEIAGAASKFVTGTCSNEGTIRWLAGASGFTNSDIGTFYNTGLFQIEGDCLLGAPFSGLQFWNYGSVVVASNLGTVTLTINGSFNNYGAIGAGTNSTLDILVLYTGPGGFWSGTVFNGPGLIQFSGGSVPIYCDGSITDNGTVELYSDFIGGAGSIWSGPGLLRWLGGSLDNVTFSPGFHVEIGGAGTKSISGTCTNEGTVRWLAGAGGFTNSTGGGQFYNSGLFEMDDNCALGPGLSSFQSSGTIDIPSGQGELSLTLNCGFTNSGVIDVETNSALNIVDSFNAPAFAFESGTDFAGPGTVRFTGNFGPSWIGKITVAGLLEIDSYCPPGSNSLWSGSGMLLLNGDLYNASFDTGFNVELSSVSGGPLTSLGGVCTNQGTIRCLIENPFGDPITPLHFYNFGLFQIETNCNFNSPGGFENTGTIRIPPGYGHLSLNIYEALTNSGAIDVETNSALDITGSGGPLVFESGTLFNGPGTIEFGSFSGIVCNGQITANGLVILNTSQSGNVIWTGSGLLQLLDNGRMDNVTFASGFHVEILGSGYKSMDGVCTNQGTIRYLSTGGLGGNLPPSPAGQFYNSGIFQIETNFDLNQYSPFQNTGTIRVPAGLGELSLGFVGDFTNFGVIDVETNSVLDIATPYPPTSVAFESGSDFSGSGTVRATGYVFCDGTMTVNGTFEYDSAGTIETGSTLWTGPGSLHWTGGGLPVVTFAPGFNVEISGVDPKYLTVCTNEGTLRWLGGEDLNFLTTGQVYNSGLIQIEADGNWNDTPIDNEPSGIFRQLGGEFSIDSFTNCGTVDLQRGKLDVAADFFSGSNSVYQLTLSGDTPGTNYNQLTAQNLALNGSLKVVLTNGYSPASGNSFVIANDSSQSGRFSNLTLPTLQSDLVMNVRYSPGSVLLEVDSAIFGLTNSVYTNGTFQFSLNGSSASAYDIQASSNLVDWITIGTNSPFTGSLNFTDTNASSLDHRFYRARIYP